MTNRRQFNGIAATTALLQPALVYGQTLPLVRIAAAAPVIRPDLAYQFLGGFTGLVLSADVGINKPDPRIYRILCERHGLDPAACIFIDDSERNVAAARAEGMRGIVFKDAPALSSALAAAGLAVT